MSNYRNWRRLNALLGAFWTGVAVGATLLLGSHLLATPVLAMQVFMIALAGICDLIAATDGFGGWAWYRWSRLGHILLGLSLSLGFAGWQWHSFCLLVTGLGGLSLTAIGIDILVFHGTYIKQTLLDQYEP